MLTQKLLLRVVPEREIGVVPLVFNSIGLAGCEKGHEFKLHADVIGSLSCRTGDFHAEGAIKGGNVSEAMRLE